jgi:hypothetical protein
MHAEKLTETVLHLNLGHFVGLFLLFLFFVFFLCYPFDKTTTEQHLRHHLQDWRLKDKTKIIKTETSLHLNLEGFFLFFLFYILCYFIIYTYIFSFLYLFFIFLSLFFLFSILNPLSLCLFSLLLISTQYLPVYIFEIFFVCFFVSFFVFFYLIICFSLFL